MTSCPKNIYIADIFRGIILSSLMVIISVFLSGCAGLTPSPLNQAAWDNDVEKINELIASGALVDEVAPCPRKVFKVFASSPLDNAILQGNIEAVKALPLLVAVECVTTGSDRLTLQCPVINDK